MKTDIEYAALAAGIEGYTFDPLRDSGHYKMLMEGIFREPGDISSRYRDGAWELEYEGRWTDGVKRRGYGIKATAAGRTIDEALFNLAVEIGKEMDDE